MPDPEDRSFDPADETVEANRSIEQGGGVGARELQAQRDPDRDNYSDVEAEVEQAAADEAEGSVEGLQQGRTNTNREQDDESDDLQGAGTTEANRDRVRGDPGMNP